MSIKTYEGIVEKGKIRLKTDIKLPENARVYIIVPDLKAEKKKPIQILSPRLANRKDAPRFKMVVTEEKPNARI